MGIIQLLSLGLPQKVLSQGSCLVNDLTKQVLGSRFMRMEADIVCRLDDVSIQMECIVAADSVWTLKETLVRAFLHRESEHNVP